MLCLVVDEGLDAEADTVDAAFEHGGEGCIVELAGGALDGDLSIRENDEIRGGSRRRGA